MWKSVTLRRIASLVLFSVLMSGTLTLLLYRILTPQVFARSQLQELAPRARFLANLTAQIYAEDPSLVSDPAMRGLFGTDNKWGAATYLLDIDGTVLLPSQREGGAMLNNTALLLRDELPSLLSGQELAFLRRAAGGTHLDMLIVAMPILVGHNVVGIVCMIKPLSEIVAALASLLSTLWISSLLSLALLIPLAGLAAWHLTRPLRRMRERALRMANGDLRVRVDIQAHGEIGELAGALNKLAERLGSTISALMLERNRALRILNALDEGIMAVDVEGEIIQINPSLHTLLQLRPGDQLPDPISSAFFAAIRENKVQSLQLPHQDVILEISVLPLTEQGHVIGAVGVFRDGTQAWRLEQTRRDYVANVSHELRSPLTALRCLIEPLYDGMVPGEEKKRELYGVLLRETMRLSRLVDDMLELSRLQSGSIALEKQVFDLPHVLREIADTYQAHARDKECMLTLTLPASLPRCYGNPDRLEQVLIALLDNALKFTPPKGDIFLQAELREDHIEISVSDTGPGIAKEDLPHIFERFYKADKAHSGKGTGLGLAIAREVMQRLGETIRAENLPEGGARFIVTVHLAE